MAQRFERDGGNRTINEIMTHDPRMVDARSSIMDAAREMRDGDIGALVVMQDGNIAGLLTDRDIVVRALAEGRDTNSTMCSDICSTNLQTMTPDQTLADAAGMMRDNYIRRIVIEQDGRPVGMLSIGDLAVERDPESALAEISAASPNN
jgi:signal-transduction protein with cAMP-binding, CBS, and nucleotidyltransferase domain